MAQVVHHLNHLQLALLKVAQLLITQACLQQHALPSTVTSEMPHLSALTPLRRGDKLMEAIMAAGRFMWLTAAYRLCCCLVCHRLSLLLRM